VTLHTSIDPIQAASLFVAACALAVTIWQGVVTRKHNRLSVTPVLTLYRREIDGLISVRNNGTGPALVIDYEVYFGEGRLKEEDIPRLIPCVVDTGTLLPGAAIAPGEEVVLFKGAALLDGSHIEPLELLRFRISYKSVYNEKRVLE
jgi:hypothetical protein